jgi:hypothetical protein
VETAGVEYKGCWYKWFRWSILNERYFFSIFVNNYWNSHTSKKCLCNFPAGLSEQSIFYFINICAMNSYIVFIIILPSINSFKCLFILFLNETEKVCD